MSTIKMSSQRVMKKQSRWFYYSDQQMYEPSHTVQTYLGHYQNYKEEIL